jgi:hypothetical protein
MTKKRNFFYNIIGATATIVLLEILVGDRPLSNLCIGLGAGILLVVFIFEPLSARYLWQDDPILLDAIVELLSSAAKRLKERKLEPSKTGGDL